MQEGINIENNDKKLDSEVVSNSTGQFYGSDLPKHVQYTTKQKLAMAGLGFFAFIVFILWIVQMKNSLSDPFDFGGGVVDQSHTVDTSTDLTKDTDGDGLTDYDEINIYKTSPYLEDSDSDGISDRLEVMGNNDPTCASGADCSGAVNDTMNQRPSSLKTNNPVITNVTKDNSSGLFSGDLTVSELRVMFQKSGVDKSIVDSFSDEQLMQLYNDKLGEISSE